VIQMEVKAGLSGWSRKEDHPERAENKRRPTFSHFLEWLQMGSFFVEKKLKNR